MDRQTDRQAEQKEKQLVTVTPRIEPWDLVLLIHLILANEKQTPNNAVNEFGLLSDNFCLSSHRFFSFQTFTFLLAWHFPHRYLLNIFIKRENNSKMY